MKELDDYGLNICKYQGNLFALSLKYSKSSSPIFLRRFMLSTLAKRMDGDGFLFEALDYATAVSEVEEKFNKNNYGQIKFSTEELYWIGYIYRYWCYTYGYSSDKVYHLVKPATLRELYYPYHSLDPAQVIERIIEANNLEDIDCFTKGLTLLKTLRRRRGETSC